MSVREFYTANRNDFEWLIGDIKRNFNNYTAANKQRKVDTLKTYVNQVIELNKTKQPTEQEEFTNLWTHWQPRIEKACAKLQITNLAPAVLPDQAITTEIIVEMQAPEYFKLADNILPKDFDGSPDKLRTFIDALELLSAATPANLIPQGVSFVKTRLSGKARDVVTNEATLVAIAQVLTARIKSEPVGQLIDQLMGLKVEGSRSDYAKKVEEVGIKLRRSFIADGANAAIADGYAAKHTVQALVNNSPTAEVRTVLKASSFSTPQEAIAKYSALAAESSSSRVGYFRNKSGNYRRHNYNYNNNNGNERRHNNNNNRNNWSNRSTNARSNNSYQQHNSTRRAFAITSENINAHQQAPQ